MSKGVTQSIFKILRTHTTHRCTPIYNMPIISIVISNTTLGLDINTEEQGTVSAWSAGTQVGSPEVAAESASVPCFSISKLGFAN